MNRRYPAALSLLSFLSACSGAPSEFGPDANQIRVTEGVPRAVRAVAAEMLHRCNIPARGRTIFWQWEAGAGEPSYTLMLSRQQVENATVRQCLERQAKALGVAGEIDWSTEAMPPPPANSD